MTLLNICIRALGCRIEHIHSFGEWVDANNVHRFNKHCAELRKKRIPFWKDKIIIGYARLGSWLIDQTENDYAKLRPVLEGIAKAKTGDELISKLKLSQIAGYRSHLLYALLYVTNNHSPIANRRTPQLEVCVMGSGAKRGLSLLSTSLEMLHKHYNPLRLSYDDIEHGLCFFHKLYIKVSPIGVTGKKTGKPTSGDEHAHFIPNLLAASRMYLGLSIVYEEDMEEDPDELEFEYDGNVPPVSERLAAYRQDAVDEFPMLDS